MKDMENLTYGDTLSIRARNGNEKFNSQIIFVIWYSDFWDLHGTVSRADHLRFYVPKKRREYGGICEY